MANGINDIFWELRNNPDLYYYLLPFLLIFTIIFAILEKTLIFGHSGDKKKPKTNINVIFALLVSAIVVIEQTTVELINTYLPGVSLIIVIGIFFMLITAMFSQEGWKGFPFWMGAIIALVAVFWSLSNSVYGGYTWGFLGIDREVIYTLLVIGAVVGVILAVVKGSRST